MNLMVFFNVQIEILLFYLYTFSLYPHKFGKWKDYLIILIGHLVNFSFYLLHSLNLNILISAAMYFTLFFILTDTDLCEKLINTFCSMLMITLSELLVEIPTILFHKDTVFEYTSRLQLLGVLFCTRCVHFCLIVCLCKIRKNIHRYKMAHTTKVMLAAFLFATSLALSSIQNLGFLSVLNDKQLPWVFAVLLSIIALCTGAVVVICMLSKSQDKLTRTELELQQLETEKNYDQLLTQMDKDQKILIHDIKNHLQNINSLMKNGDDEEAMRYLSELGQSGALNDYGLVSENHTFSILMSKYHSVCTERGISFHLDIKSSNLLFLSPANVTSIFSNLLDNAVEAATGSQDAFIDLTILEDSSDGSCIITMVNSCCNPPMEAENGLFATNKMDRTKHGFGLFSIRQTVKQFNGLFRNYYDKEDCTFHTILTLYTR